MMNNSSITRRRKENNTKDPILKLGKSFDSDASVEIRRKLVKRRRKKRKKDEEPFIITNIKVGSVIATICVLIYVLSSTASSLYSVIMSSDNEYGDNVWSQYVNDEGDGYTGGIAEPVKKSKITPNFDVSEHKINAFNVAESLMNIVHQIDEENEEQSMSNNKIADIINSPEKKAIVDVLKSLEKLKQMFAETYGGENAAREIIERGIITFSPSSLPSSSKSVDSVGNIQNLARRIFQAKKENKSFKVSFAGSSAVAGYGNYLKQTFPSVLVDLLTEPLEALGVELEVRNAAVADIAPFPYGWCLDNFMGDNVDVVSWDSSFLQSRGDNDAAFESYLRRVTTLESSPFLIIREGVYSASKRQILQKYIDNGNLVDPIIININAAAEPFLELHEDVIPDGFKDWLEFGAPESSPGKVGSGRTIRLSVKQHELVAWLISMHFITAVELGAANILGLDDVKSDWLENEFRKNKLILPKPQAEIQDKDLDLMFGDPTDEKLGNNSTEWIMDEIYCRTTFEPIVSGGLESIVVSGSSSEDLDLLLPRGPMLYNKNWIMALGSDAKQTAYSEQKFKFDYRFQKKAYYGVNPSGNLTFFVPFIENQKKKHWKLNFFNRKNKPTDSINSIVVCEVNEHIGEKECDMLESMSYMIGGIVAKPQSIEANGVSFQGKKNCVRLDVSPQAKWTTRTTVENHVEVRADSRPISLRKASKNSDETGIPLQIWVKDRFIFWKDGPCSISHVIWQQKRKK